MDNNNFTRFLLTLFLGCLGSIIINHTYLKPNGFRSRSWAYCILGVLTLGIYPLVASVCNLSFNSSNYKNIGYIRE